MGRVALTHTARQKGLVSSFLAIDIKGFFDHVNHKRMIHVLKKKGFPKEICDWMESFLSNQTVKIRIDDYTFDFFELTIGVCQGHSSLDAPSELNPPQRIPSPLFVALLVPQAEG